MVVVVVVAVVSGRGFEIVGLHLQSQFGLAVLEFCCLLVFGVDC